MHYKFIQANELFSNKACTDCGAYVAIIKLDYSYNKKEDIPTVLLHTECLNPGCKRKEILELI